MKDTIRLFALQNAVKFKGKANPKAVLGAVMKQFPEARKDTKKTEKIISNIVDEVNTLSADKQKKELLKIDPDYFSKEKQKAVKRKKIGGELQPLPHAKEGKVVTRMPPEPSKYLHIGHALSFLINYLYAKKYKGKCVLRFDDTNPKLSKQEYVDATQKEIMEYLELKPDSTLFASDYIGLFYDYADKLIQKGDAYICKCSGDTISKNRTKKKVCGCRSAQNQGADWSAMKKGKFERGTCVLRFVGDMTAGNAVLRDPILFRIVKDKHYRLGKKFVCWPLYDFASVIEDHVAKITHILQSSEFGKMRIELQELLRKKLNLNSVYTIQYGRFTIRGAATQGRVIREMIEKGEISGWDDPRLVTLKALQRRGILKDTLVTIAKQIGLSSTQTPIDWKMISAINRGFLDPNAYRYLFVAHPVAVKIKGAPKQKLDLPYHPEKDLGHRTVKTEEAFYLSKQDIESMKDGKLYRLKDCLNFRQKGKTYVFEEGNMVEYKKEGKGIFQWVPEQGAVDVTVLMPDGKTVKGKGEKHIASIKSNSVVQFIRFGFCRKEKSNKFIYTHE